MDNAIRSLPCLWTVGTDDCCNAKLSDALEKFFPKQPRDLKSLRLEVAPLASLQARVPTKLAASDLMKNLNSLPQ
jgi:hypothetical protein